MEDQGRQRRYFPCLLALGSLLGSQTWAFTLQAPSSCLGPRRVGGGGEEERQTGTLGDWEIWGCAAGVTLAQLALRSLLGIRVWSPAFQCPLQL